MRTNHHIFAVAVLCLVASGCSCTGNDTTPDTTQDSSVQTDVFQDVVRDIIENGDSIDIVKVDACDAGADDIPGTDMIEEVCGSLTTDTARTEGQPCENEDESYCTDVGSYPRIIGVAGWQCIKPGMVTCVRNENDSLLWVGSNCEENLSTMAASCGLTRTPVTCFQYDKHAVCCPYSAKSPVAGYGTKCDLFDIGKNSCSPDGQKDISGFVWECGFQTEIASKQDDWFDGQEYQNMECESIYAECPYWYRLDYCSRDIDDCHIDEGCTLVEPPDSYSYYSCPGVCFYDDEQDINRCTTTCDELDYFYDNN